MFKSAFFLIASILLFFTGNLLATNYYISTNSTGSANASSWTNKKIYTSFSWSTLIGGDTVYFDGGSDSLTYGKVLISSLLPSSQVVITNGKDATHNGKAIITLTSNAPAGSEDGAFTLQHCKNVKVTGLTFKIAAAPTTPDTYVNFVVFFNYGGSLINPSSNVLDNCHLISTGNGSLLDLGGETKDTIKNCIMEIPINTIGEEQDGINVYAGGGGHTFIGNTVTIGGMGGTHHKDLMQWGGGEGLDNNYETVIANNLFAYVAPAAVGLGNGGLYIENIHSNRFLIYNNIVSVRVSDPMTCLCIAPDDATYEVYNISARVYNNTFINGTYHGMGVRFDYADTLIFKNNIVIDDSVGGSIFYTKYRGLGYIKYKDIDYNQYYINGTSVFIDTSGSGTISFANWQSLKGYDTHGSAGNISFVNRWGSKKSDFYPTSITLGTNLSTIFTTDLMGISRPLTWTKGPVEPAITTTNNTYYVASNGNDANSGTSILSPWKSISKVNSKSVNPGDKILFRRGDTWSEVLTPTSSGNSTSPIVYDCYGSGNLPTIDGGSVRNNCISINGVNYVTIRNFRVQNSVVNSNGNIHAINTNNLRIESCDFYITSHGGVNIESSLNGYIGFCTMSSPVNNNNNQADGIYSQKNSNCVFENNNIIISDMGTAQNDGIQSYLDANMTLRNNYIFQNNTLTQAQGIDISDGTGTFNVYNNVIKCPSSNGNILGFNNDVTGTAALRCYQNTVLGNLNCLRVLKCTDYIIQNNIFYSNSATSIIDLGMAPNSISSIDYNLYNRNGSGSIVNFEPQGLKTYSQWQSMGYESHGLNANPVVNDTLCPATTSPVINAGTNLNSTFSYDKDGNLRPLNGVDLGAYEIKSALPVELTTFTGNYVNNYVRLNWSTATEVNNQGFDIERSSSLTWEKIGFVQGKGNSVIKNDYSFEDKSPIGIKIQYRLKQVDNNGKFKYSDIVEVTTIPQSFSIGNYPNPFNPSTKIRYSIPTESMTKIVIYNLIGEKIDELKNEIQLPGIYELNWNASNHPSGIYLLSINESPVNGGVMNSKVIKMSLIK